MDGLDVLAMAASQMHNSGIDRRTSKSVQLTDSREWMAAEPVEAKKNETKTVDKKRKKKHRSTRRLTSISDKIEEGLQSNRATVYLSIPTARSSSFKEPELFQSNLVRNAASRQFQITPKQQELEDLRGVMMSFARNRLDKSTHTVNVLNANAAASVHQQQRGILYTQLHNSESPSTISRLTMHTEDAYRESLGHLGMQPTSAKWMLHAAQRSNTHDYRWPVRVHREVEGVDRIQRKRKRVVLLEDIGQRQTTEWLQEKRERAVLQSGYAAHFVPTVRGNQMQWTQHFDVDATRMEDWPFRSPAAACRSLASRLLNLQVNSSLWGSGKELFVQNLRSRTSHRQERNPEQNLNSEQADDSHSHRNSHSNIYLNEIEYQDMDRSRQDAQDDRLRKEIAELVLARHFEGLSDAVLHMVFSQLKPFLSIANQQQEATQGSGPSDDDLVTISQLQDASQSSHLSLGPDNEAESEGGDKAGIHIALSKKDTETVQRLEVAENLSYAQAREQQQQLQKGGHKKDTRKRQLFGPYLSMEELLRRRPPAAPRKTEEDADMTPLEDQQPLNGCINWQHILLALQMQMQQCDGDPDFEDNTFRVKVHPSLPSLTLTANVLERVQARLTSLFAEVQVGGVTKSIPSLLSRSKHQ